MDAASIGTASVSERGADGQDRGVTAHRGPEEEGEPGTGGDGPGRPEPLRAVTAGAGPLGGRRTRIVLAVAAVGVFAAALVLRFWTRSDLWLDEALTVDIARQPLAKIPGYLHQDGAPPLYYVLLHFWMGIFGTSDLGVRSLSGVFGVATVPLAWLAGRRLGGRPVAWSVALLVASSPFAVRYDTEARMYSLVAMLTVLGFLAVDRALRRPRPGNLVAVAVVTGLLLYSHYWSLYLVAVTGAWLVWQAWRGREVWRRGARAALAAVAVGCLTFLPWVPTFLFQSRHTGTPWAAPANFAAMVNAVTSFAGGATNQGRALALLYFALCGLALFGLAVDRTTIELDLRTRPLARPMAVVVGGTLGLAVAGGFASNSTFDVRYASVVFVPLVLLVGIGLTTFVDPRLRTGLLSVAVVAGLAGAAPNVTTNRTQAGEVSAALASHARPGDVVAYCPDQLGPAVNRLLPGGRYRQITYPRDTGPAFVDWVDYAKASASASPVAFAQRLEAMAGSAHQIFVVWAPGYQTFGTSCQGIVQTLQGDPAFHVTGLVNGHASTFYQPMWLVQFAPAPR